MVVEIAERILLPAPLKPVWEILGDLRQNSAWQLDCQSVRFLSRHRSGNGARWRSGQPDGGEAVLEIIAWYDGLGYEYRYVDGAPFRNARGRLRLQEIAEGTLVQWTLAYDRAGPLGGLRDTLGRRQRQRHVLRDSLAALRTVVGRHPAHDAQYIAPSLMRDAPDIEARARYRPRHPSQLDEPQETMPGAPPPQGDPAGEDTRAIAVIRGDMQPVPESPAPMPASPPPDAPAQEEPEPAAREEPSHLSIWEVFGVERPAVSSAPDSPAGHGEAQQWVPAPLTRSAAPTAFQPVRTGLRQARRRARRRQIQSLGRPKI